MNDVFLFDRNGRKDGCNSDVRHNGSYGEHHDMGLTYNWETASLTVGINNITDEEPPLISQQAGPNRNNAVASARYDLIGTSYFLNFVKEF